MSIALDIVQSYRAPREVLRRRIGATEREDRALAVLMGACFLIFVAQWPRLSREAFLDQSIGLDARMAGALFAWLLAAPLGLYMIALLIRGVLRFAGVRVSGYEARMALFWALFAATPMWLLSGLMTGFLGNTPATAIVGLVAFASFLGIWIAGLLEITSLARDRRDA